MLGLGVFLLLAQSAFGAIRQSATVNNPPYLATHDSSFVPDKILRVTAKNVSLDCTTRYSVIINGSIPGPELRFVEGQHVWIRVYNDMEDTNVTIHWHGLSMRMSPFSDGTPMVSQWPIPPMHFFDYEFQLQKGDAGTYFYHSHVGFQAVTAGGALIVDEAPGTPRPYEYDEDRIVMISDIHHKTDAVVEAQLTGMPFMWPGNPDNVAVNGKSRFINATSSQAGPSCELAVINLDPGKTYRFRFIGALAVSFIYLNLEAHNMVIIEVDGRYVMPYVPDHLEVSSGQRYSALVFAKTQAELTGADGSIKNRYWMQLETHPQDDADNVLYAIIKYNAGSSGPVDTFTLPAAPVLPLPKETFADGWIEDRLQPLNPDPDNPWIKMEDITRRIYVNLTLQINPATGHAQFIQDGAPWFENTPQEPYLVSLYKNNTKYFPDYNRALANGGFDPVTTTFPAKIGEVLEIVWYLVGDNLMGSVETHPWHSHGDHYWDAGTGNGTYDPVANEAKLTARHGRIITRDTSNTYRPNDRPFLKGGPGFTYSWRSFRIRVKNPGVWMMHCHMLQHMVMGMQTVWVFGDAKDVTPVSQHLLDQGYLVYGGTAYGNATYAPRVLHYFADEVDK
ncbi:uncharacterized protein LOC129599791 [Paramacrobiotus metropolitanus]|uniref:uncharacterized protein LOC129599791 n=1 Tax=Paramacrobiotus metropolitanus TaxID=2943436 RepID=UPI002445A9AC|nr:uncharacterized protein LOC129599791 [Paramacrobiotus metropolitanus]